MSCNFYDTSFPRPSFSLNPRRRTKLCVVLQTITTSVTRLPSCCAHSNITVCRIRMLTAKIAFTYGLNYILLVISRGCAKFDACTDKHNGRRRVKSSTAAYSILIAAHCDYWLLCALYKYSYLLTYFFLNAPVFRSATIGLSAPLAEADRCIAADRPIR